MDRVNYSIRIAKSEDASGMLEIYAHSIKTSIATFEEVVPTAEDFAKRIELVLPHYPWLVAESEQGEIVGYAYGHQHSPRAGYRWTAEISVYIDKNHQRKGIGRLLYEKLISFLKAQGFFNLLAIISPPNSGSERLHKAMGFEKAGTYSGIGYKFGQWQTTCWWQLQLAPLPQEPIAPKSFAEFRQSIVAKDGVTLM